MLLRCNAQLMLGSEMVIVRSAISNCHWICAGIMSSWHWQPARHRVWCCGVASKVQALLLGMGCSGTAIATRICNRITCFPKFFK
jgi:hypothetical protein